MCIKQTEGIRFEKGSLTHRLRHIAKMSQLIQVRSGNPSRDSAGAVDEEDSALFFKSFPIFIWLLRDVVLALPEQCYNMKEYFLSTVSTF